MVRNNPIGPHFGGWHSSDIYDLKVPNIETGTTKESVVTQQLDSAHVDHGGIEPARPIKGTGL